MRWDSRRGGRVSSDAPEPGVRVFLLDDHEVVRRGVADVLESDPGISVIGEGKNASEALARVPALRPDVAVLDVRLPDGDGVSVCRELRSRMPDLKVIMLTSYSDDEALFERSWPARRATCSSRSSARTWSPRYGRWPRVGRCSTR